VDEPQDGERLRRADDGARQALRPRRPVWLTFNEEFFYEFIEQGNFPLSSAQVLTMRANLIAAHKRAYAIIHRYSPHAMVSSNYAWPGRGSLASIETDPFLHAVRKQLDYLALDYYYPAYDQLATLSQLSAGTSWNIPLDPFGMYTALRSMHRAFGHLPLLITENGMPTHNAAPRADGVTRSETCAHRLLGAARSPRRRAGDRLHVLEPHRQLRMGQLRRSLRALLGQRPHRPAAHPPPDGGGRHLPASDL
jgi:Glycosyl hydrolase family 1